MYSLFIVDYGLYPMHPHTMASGAAVEFDAVTKIYHRNVYDIKLV
jgi:hypothetical protein